VYPPPPPPGGGGGGGGGNPNPIGLTRPVGQPGGLIGLTRKELEKGKG